MKKRTGVTSKEFIDYLTYALIGMELEDLDERAHSLYEKMDEYSEFLSRFGNEFINLQDTMSEVCTRIGELMHEHELKGKPYDEIISRVQKECETETEA